MTGTRVAAVAFALSVWVQGSSQLRESFLYDPNFTLHDYSLFPLSPPDDPTASLPHRLAEWFTRWPRPLDDTEKAFMGIFDILTSLAMLRLVGLKPLSPTIFSPFVLSSLTLPSSILPRHPKWSRMIGASMAFALLQELQRVLVVQLVKQMRRRAKERSKKGYPGSVVAHGAPAVLEDADQACLICSGFADDAVDQLQGICTAAADKHAVHLKCFLRWQREYIHQRAYPDPIQVECSALEADGHEHDQAESSIAKGKAILKSAGLGYLARALQPAVDETWERLLYPYPRQAGSTLAIRPPSSSDPSIATLTTSSPPCPGCRSPVQIQLYPKKPKTPLTGWAFAMRVLKDAGGDALILVTGRSILMKVLTQLSFLFAILAVLKRRPRRVRA